MGTQIVSGNRRIEQKKRGKAAEDCVRAILESLSQTRFLVLNNIQAKYGNIDHLVISREGAVFLIETKGHRGRASVRNGEILLNGEPTRKNFIGQINRNIQWLRDKVKTEVGVNPWIVSVLVFTNCVVGGRKTVKRINVVGKDSLLALIEDYSPKTTRRAIWNRRDELEKSLTKSRSSVR